MADFTPSDNHYFVLGHAVVAIELTRSNHSFHSQKLSVDCLEEKGFVTHQSHHPHHDRHCCCWPAVLVSVLVSQEQTAVVQKLRSIQLSIISLPYIVLN